MAQATLTSKGQVTIPVAVREAMGLAAGDRIEFVEVEQGEYSIVSATHGVETLKGIIPKPTKAVSVDEMNAAIASAKGGGR